MRRTLVIALAVAGIATIAASCSNGPSNPNPRADMPLRSVPVDLARYMGRWYVIANIPYFAERDFVATHVEWTLREDGKIEDVFHGRKNGFDKPETRHRFIDTVKPGSGGGEWSVQLFWPIRVTQMTLWVAPDYRYTILGYPDRKLGWIFSREATMSDDTYRSLLARLDAMGYDTTRFRRVPQTPAQIGQAGFQSPGQDE
jgi:apolipoprotein D and lipocalin family protein